MVGREEKQGLERFSSTRKHLVFSTSFCDGFEVDVEGESIQWPKRSAQEWETFYSSTDQIQGKIMEMIGERFEEIQAGHEKERDVEKGWTEEDDRLIVEELGRIERFREENVVAWKSLARFVSPPPPPFRISFA